MPWDQFPGNRPNKPQSRNDVASRPLPRSPVISSLDNVVRQMIIRSPRVRPGKFVFGDAKRLLQQYLPTADSSTAANGIVIRSPHRRKAAALWRRQRGGLANVWMINE